MTVGKTHYQILEVAKGASQDDIKKAYHNLAKKYHPDKNKEAGAEDKFKEIGTAYETLKDSDKRRVYDMQQEGDSERTRRQGTTTTGATGSSTGAGSNFRFNTNGPGPSFSFRSTFTSFDDDEFFKRARRDFDNMADRGSTAGGTKSKPSKKKKEYKPSQRHFDSFTRPEWDTNFADGNSDADPEQGQTFRHFFVFDEDYDPFADFDKMFEEVFNDPFFSARGHPPGTNRRGAQYRPRQPFRASNTSENTARDKGGEDLGSHGNRMPSAGARRRGKAPADDSENMWDWSKPMFTHKNKHDKEDSDYDLLDTQDDSGSHGNRILLACYYCGRKFNPSTLDRHESVCRGWNQYRQRNKTAKSDEEGEPDDDKPGKKTGGYRFTDSPQPKRKNWRKQDDDLVNNMRNARKATKAQREGRSMPPPPPPDEYPDLIECRWCHRRFNDEAAARHIPYCAERTTQRGSPQTPLGSHTARDYGSKNHHAKQYAKSVPKPNAPNKPASSSNPSHTSGAAGAGDKAGQKNPTKDDKGASKSEPTTPRRGGLGGPPRHGARNTMDGPYNMTGSGLHAAPGGSTSRTRTTGLHTTGGRNVRFNVHL